MNPSQGLTVLSMRKTERDLNDLLAPDGSIAIAEDTLRTFVRCDGRWLVCCYAPDPPAPLRGLAQPSPPEERIAVGEFNRVLDIG